MKRKTSLMRVSENFRKTLERVRDEYAKLLNIERNEISYTVLTDKIAREWKPKIKKPSSLEKLNEKIENFMDSITEE